MNDNNEEYEGARLVADVTVEAMDGDTALEKAINAYLTRRFIVKKDVPADECLSEAKAIVGLCMAHLGAHADVVKSLDPESEDFVSILEQMKRAT